MSQINYDRNRPEHNAEIEFLNEDEQRLRDGHEPLLPGRNSNDSAEIGQAINYSRLRQQMSEDEV